EADQHSASLTPDSGAGLERRAAHDLHMRGSLIGERKQATVLFAEITDSAGRIQTLDPEDAETLLDAAMGSLLAVVHDYQGTITQLHSTGLVALFGAPIAHEDHALRTCYAALAIRAVIRRAADEVRQRHGVT